MKNYNILGAKKYKYLEIALKILSQVVAHYPKL